MKTADKKAVAILVLLVLLLVTGIGWFSAQRKITHEIPYDNTYKWTEFFHGYEAYLDRRISYAVMRGKSMAPTINDNDTVLWVEVENKAELKVGDIIIYKHPTITGLDNIAHRIIGVETIDGEYRFRTRGDNLSEPDQHLVSEELVHGLVIGVLYRAALE